MSERQKPVWLGEISDEERQLILDALSPEERFSVLFKAAGEQARDTNMGEARMVIQHLGETVDVIKLKDIRPGLLQRRLYTLMKRAKAQSMVGFTANFQLP